MPELNEKTQYKFQSCDDLFEPESLSDGKIARIVFDALFKEPPNYVRESNRVDFCITARYEHIIQVENHPISAIRAISHP